MPNQATLNLTSSTTPNSVGDNEFVTAWNDLLYYDSQRKMFWSNFEGAEGTGAAVIRKDDFRDGIDTIKINTSRLLSGTGVTGESTLRGNEEQLRTSQVTLTTDIVRHAVAFTEKAILKSKSNLYSRGQYLLSQWIAKKMDDAIFAKFGTVTPTLYAGDATSVATLDASDTLSMTTLRKIYKTLAASEALPLVTINGEPMYGLVIHTNDAYNLRSDSVWQQVQRDANVRGETNPLFTGAMGVAEGLVIYRNNGVVNTANKSTCIAFGGESIFRGYTTMPKMRKQQDDYGMANGMGVMAYYGETLNNNVNTNFLTVGTYAA